MNRRIVQGIILLAVASACGRDEAPQSLQQADSLAAGAAGPAGAATTPATTPAPAGGGTGTKAPAPSPAPTPSREDAERAAAASEASELAAAPRLRTVQVASFISGSRARALQARLERDGVPAWTSTMVTPVVEGGETFTRVRVGVATTGAEARELADKIRAKYNWPVWITLVEDRSALPPNALRATRSFVGGM
jgi:cell division septation protein DedD